jgi:hypothetical protein
MHTIFLGEDEIEGICHLLCGLTPSASICHRQRQRDAVGGVEEVAAGFSEHLIQVKGEGTVSVDQNRQISFIHIG